MIKKNSRIYVAGHKGLIGSAIVRNLILKGYKNIITISRNKLDLTNQKKVLKFLKKKKPHFIFIAAAKVGGTNKILAVAPVDLTACFTVLKTGKLR